MSKKKSKINIKDSTKPKLKETSEKVAEEKKNLIGKHKTIKPLSTKAMVTATRMSLCKFLMTAG